MVVTGPGGAAAGVVTVWAGAVTTDGTTDVTTDFAPELVTVM